MNMLSNMSFVCVCVRLLDTQSLFVPLADDARV